MSVNIDRSYEVAPKVSVRPERFGGLVYRYDNRALLFLHSRQLVDFLVQLDGTKPLGTALAEFSTEQGIGDDGRRALQDALGQLKAKGIIHEL